MRTGIELRLPAADFLRDGIYVCLLISNKNLDKLRLPTTIGFPKQSTNHYEFHNTKNFAWKYTDATRVRQPPRI